MDKKGGDLIRISEFDPKNLTDKDIIRLLYHGIQDDLLKGECIFVPGSSKASEYRLPEAIRLYKEGRANKLLLSGGVKWPGNDLPEAELLKNKAIRLGIPQEDILIEDISLHTKENVLASMLVLDRAFGLQHISRLVIVTAPFHMRRMHLTMLTYMPKWIQYSLVCANDHSTRPDNWFLNPYGRKRAEDEAKKIIYYVQQGILKDMEV
ncbi:DUF218 domain-containing protein [Cytobacillus oceanisediminis]|jgi:uncharacterized SAM-binding protein YcdF (DUF218 family)|uniref:DUF218 domain-containing protein n=1 Tax=Cytobacillus oceanisediminis TaxID=665099 RepID=A0A2V3A4D7_9BACI|nr:YdcF family protein [Cytobacillus oceanisediminis]PWW31872.1 DUF218 domain-containing protein [Cytobacillus oceanisediminis]